METAVPIKRGRGRPSQFRQEFIAQARKLAALGATDVELADFFCVSKQTLNTWKQKHPQFLDSLRAGKADTDRAVERSLLNMALGFERENERAVVCGDEVVTVKFKEFYPPQVRAAETWLFNRKRDEWRNRQVVEVKDERAMESLSDAELEQMILKERNLRPHALSRRN